MKTTRKYITWCFLIVLYSIILGCINNSDSSITHGVNYLSNSNDTFDTLFIRLSGKYWIHGRLIYKGDTDMCFAVNEINNPTKFVLFIRGFRVSRVLSFDVDSVPYYIVDSLKSYGFNVKFDTTDIPRFVYISAQEDSLICYVEQHSRVLLCEQLEITLDKIFSVWKHKLLDNTKNIIGKCAKDIDFHRDMVTVELIPLERIDSIVGNHNISYNYDWKSEIMFIRLIYKEEMLWKIEVLPLYARFKFN